MKYYRQYNFNKNEWKIFAGQRRIFCSNNRNCANTFMSIHGMTAKPGAISEEINEWTARIEIERK